MTEGDDLRAIREIPGALERARRAHVALPELEQIRKDAIAEASLQGESQAAIGKALGITRQAISRLLIGGPGPERAFWGAAANALTVAVGGKTEDPSIASGKPGPVVAVEDLAAFAAVRDAVEPLGIRACHEVISPPGFVDLNRDGLVVICGPRLSPMVAQVLASDRNLGFARDNGGWHIEDRRTKQAIRSPMDEGDCADIGYLGRLPRPDGQGTFLYVAGIHAPGAPGVIHYLATNLDEVWRQVRDRRFSALVRCTFDPANRGILTSERITDFYEGN